MIRLCADAEELAREAAKLFVRETMRAAEAHGRSTVLLAGGETPRRCYENLSGPPFRDQVPWRKLHLFWGDERCVPAGDLRSNALMARRALLDHVPVPVSQIHPIAGDRPPTEAAGEYEKTLRSFFPGGLPRFDLVLLGLGTNGHTASLFPGTSALQEKNRWVVEVRPADDAIERVTLTTPVINEAACIAFLVAGKEKAEILREVLEGSPDPFLIPARLIRPVRGELLWLVDSAAGALLRPPAESSE
jgi:6-phosphogluconolactonase